MLPGNLARLGLGLSTSSTGIPQWHSRRAGRRNRQCLYGAWLGVRKGVSVALAGSVSAAWSRGGVRSCRSEPTADWTIRACCHLIDVSEAVAIISVSASAVVGLGGLLATTFGGTRQRKWESQEERAIELRSVLDDGGQRIAELLLQVDEAHNEVLRDGRLSPERRAGLDSIQRGIALSINRVGLRRGSQAAEYSAMGAYWAAVSRLTVILEEAHDGLDSEQASTYSQTWTEALAAESAYLDSTARTLAS